MNSDHPCEDYFVIENPPTFRYSQSHDDWYILEKWNGTKYEVIDEGHTLEWREFAQYVGFTDISVRYADDWDENDEPVYGVETKL